MDRLSTHFSGKSKDKMRELGIRWIYNVAYEPDYNPIELVFSMVKRNFKQLRAQKLMGLIHDSHEQLVTKSVQRLKKKDIVNCVNHVIKILR